MMSDESKNDQVKQQVREGYKVVAAQGSLREAIETGAKGCCGGQKVEKQSSCCCGNTTAEALAEKLGYSAEAIEALPEGANMGLSCGNPTAIASLREGQVVVDLGSGGGFDVFLAGPKVGASGRVIGVDMTPEMLSKARKNITGYTQSTGLHNVEFRLGEIEHLPIADNSVDVVISNSN